MVKIMAGTGVPVDLWVDLPLPDDPIAKGKISKTQIVEAFGMIISAKVYAEKQK